MDPNRVPVIVGTGQAIEREAIVTSLDLAERAAVAALHGSGRLSSAVERVSMLSALFSPGVRRPATDLADRLGLGPGGREMTPGGGNYPQWLVTRAAEQIAAGELACTLIAGAESARSHKLSGGGNGLFRAAPADAESDPVVGHSQMKYFSDDEVTAGIRQPTTLYPLFESARAAEAGRSFAEQRAFLGPAMARFTEAAAKHPFAWFPQAATAEELSTPSAANRLISEPYPKRMNAFPFVDLAAALVVCSLAVARDAGLEDQAVFVWGGADAAEVALASARPRIGHSAGMRAAVGRTFEAAGVGVDDIAAFDFYSCFPVAVQIAAEEVGLALDDPRGLTVTGGLPYFGGPGNNYSTHGIATLVDTIRQSGGLALCVAIGGFVTKQSAGIYGTTPPPDGFRRGDTVADQAAIDATAIETVAEADGLATVDANTVSYDHTGAVAAAPLIAHLPDGRRLAAAADPAVLADAAGQLLVGRQVRVSGSPLHWRLADG